MAEIPSLQRAAEDALFVQDACNLSGVVKSLARHVDTIWEVAYAEGHGTEWVNNHPIVRLFVDKLASLCGMQFDASFNNFRVAHDECERLAAGVHGGH